MAGGSYNAVINLWIGDLMLCNCTENMVSIDNVRVGESVSESTVIELYDVTALVVDNAIANLGGRSIQFQYGYANGVLSEKYEGTITKYSTEFRGFSSMCTIELVSTGVVQDNSGDPTAKKKSYTGTVSDIVYQIASEEGWKIGSIETTKKNKTIEITRYTQTSLEFIETQLVKKAVSEGSGKSNYKVSLRDEDGSKVLYFTTKAIKDIKKKNKKGAVDAYNYQYVIGMPNDNIISFEPSYNEVLASLVGAASVECSSLNPDTNEQVDVNVQSNVEVSDDMKSKVRYVGGNSYTYDELKAMAKTMNEVAGSLSYPATLVIKGTPRIQPYTSTKILVLTREGQVHHASGEYLITSVEDLIENGMYSTTLQLTKNATPESLQNGEQTGSNGETGGTGGNSKNIDTTGVDASLAEKVKKYLGTPYVWGGESWAEGGFDCSGFVWHFLKNECKSKQIGGRTTAAGLSSRGTAVPYDSKFSQCKPGDLMFRGSPAKHVVMYMGGGKVVHAPQTGDVIKYSKLWFTPSAVRRFDINA